MRLLNHWPHERLAGVCTKIGSGSTPRGGDSVYVEEGASFIRSQNVYNGLFSVDGLAYLTNEHADQLSSVTVESNDVLLNITGDSVARCCHVPDAVLPARVNQHVAIIRPKPERLLPQFLCYYLISPMTQRYLLSRAGSGGTRKALTKSMIEALEVPCPTVRQQERIVNLLKSYDDLIENNRRRIQLLEQSAQLLYKEWFVHLRFPGHEHVKIKNGIPEGWSLRELADLCVDGDGIQTGPFGSQLHQSDYTEDGVPVVMPRELAQNRISTEGIARVPDEVVSRLGRHKLRVGDTVYGRRGDIGRRAFIGHRENGWICGTGCLRLRPNSLKVAARYLFDALGSPQTEGTIIARARGATMPNLNASIMKSILVLIPSRSLQDIYVDIVSPTEDALINLAEQNERLCKARNLLLPRLMNGVISA
jgi:type I restriction enzyme, S subunit